MRIYFLSILILFLNSCTSINPSPNGKKLSPSTPSETLAIIKDQKNNPSTSSFEQMEAEYEKIKKEPFYAIEYLIEKAIEENHIEKVTIYSLEYLKMAESFKNNWNYGNAIFYGNFYLSYASLKQKDLSSSLEYLKLASLSPGSPQLDSFGPFNSPEVRTHLKALAELKYDQFLELLESKLNLKKIVIGYDFRFGKDKGGTYAQLKSWCEKKKIELIKIEEIKLNGLTVSTTEIKKQLDKGDMKMVTNLLGRHFYVEGVVVKGDQRGRILGFPTANLQQTEETHLPHFGVYATRVKLRGQYFNSVTNIGRTPTFKQDERVKVESHLLDFNQDIYGETIQIEFSSYLRAEKKFNSLDEIKIQIQLDINERRKM